MIACASASVSPAPKNAGDEPMPPKLPQPRMMRETSMPLRPRGRCSMPRCYAANSRSFVVVMLAVAGRVELPVLRVLEQGERVAGVARRSFPVAMLCQLSRVLPENTRALGRIVQAARHLLSLLLVGERLAAEPRKLPRGLLACGRSARRLEHSLVPLPARARSSPSRSATSASTSSGGPCSTRATPRARYSSSTPSFCASLRRSCSEGTRSPASSREMYADEQPGRDSARCDMPAASLASFNRRPTATGSSTCAW